MVRLKDNGKINFIVNIHYNYGECLTGGIVAMHYLAYLLAKEGHNVYIFCVMCFYFIFKIACISFINYK